MGIVLFCLVQSNFPVIVYLVCCCCRCAVVWINRTDKVRNLDQRAEKKRKINEVPQELIK